MIGIGMVILRILEDALCYFFRRK